MKSLIESLLDDFEDLGSSQDKEMVKQWCTDNLKGKYKVTITKDNHIKLRGDVIIKDYKDDTFPYQISFMEGNLSIEKCPNITSLEGLFIDFLSINGNLSINNCEKLVSLIGSPLTVKGSLSITGNKSLKSLEGAPELVFDNIYIMKNGKKFSFDKLAEKYDLARRIVCSLEDDEDAVNEGVVNEALNEPHLLELADQMKKLKLNAKNILFEHLPIEWDLIDSSNVQEYSKIDAKAKTKIRNVISGRDGIHGIILLRKNINGPYDYVITNKKEVLNISNEYVYSNEKYYYGRMWLPKTTTELMMKYVDMCDSAVIISFDTNAIYAKMHKRSGRAEARKGMVHNTPEYYEELARENIARYRKIIEQNRAARKSGDFDAIDKDVETIVSAAFKYAQNIRKNFKPDPNNPHSHYFETSKIENIMEEIYNKKTWVGFKSTASTVKDGYSGDDGLLSLYDQYIRLYMKVSSTGNSMDGKRLNNLKTLLDNKIKILKNLLSL